MGRQTHMLTANLKKSVTIAVEPLSVIDCACLARAVCLVDIMEVGAGCAWVGGEGWRLMWMWMWM